MSPRKTLYPNFSELISFKDRKMKSIHPKSRFSVSLSSGNHHSPFRGRGLEFDTVREYVPGDDIRNIDWRVTARTGAPHIKLFRESKERQVILCVDMNTNMRFGTRGTFKSIQAAFVAAYLGWKALDAHDSLSGCLFGDVENGLQYFSPSKTGKSFRRMLKIFSEAPTQNHITSLTTVLKNLSQAAHTGALIYVISDFMDLDDISSLIKEARLRKLNERCDVIFIAINDPSDESIPPIGPLDCIDTQGHKITIDTDVLHYRETYEESWKKNRETLRKLTFQSKIPLIQLSTLSDVRLELPKALKMCAKR